MPALNRVPLTARPMHAQQRRAELFNGARMALVQRLVSFSEYEQAGDRKQKETVRGGV